ncbi:hypothetical protein CKO38_09425 [Rhodospirillum rubrum]|uniref:hypothetical protein n=1 Tax=Rhodospirillum rubrum TaxID=1085 RepID=UPI0019051094|nr:hypothetical protein [Rhodospirillum rubrum]MBK1663362.1 hypothetical protein [Rhodospirillum rubrum]MBK1676885.1 hypothetical protein [Rhodospirillum rubrum]
MRFELYLSEINQEMIDAGRLTPHKDQEWGGNVWSKECCIINFSKHPDPGEEIILPFRGGLLLRAEADGGLAWSPQTNAVYKLDEEAYVALRDLDAGHSPKHVAKRNAISLHAVEDLVALATKAVRARGVKR